MVDAATQAAETGQSPPPRLLYTAGELARMRKLQAIAAAHAPAAGEEVPS